MILRGQVQFQAGSLTIHFICQFFFWFVLPYFIISYGLFDTLFQQLMFVFGLFLLPSFIITLHCWFINFKAALHWKKNHPNENVVRWLVKFQSLTIAIVMVFTAVITSSLFFIDSIR